MSVFNYKGGPSYRCLFPEPEGVILDESQTLGIYSMLPGIFGLLQANEALKILLDVGTVQSGHLLIFNTFNQQYNQLKIKRNPDNFNKETLAVSFSNNSNKI